MEKKIADKDLGVVTILKGSRYKRYTLRIKDGAIVGTMPEGGDEKRMLRFIDDNRSRLIKILEKRPAPLLLTEDTNMQTASFRLRIVREGTKTRVTLRDEVLTIYCPIHIRIEDDHVQESFREILKNVYRHEAKRLLPARLAMLAEQHGFSFTQVKINSSRTRWGSCSRQKNINLSLYLMRLPWHLIDYVLLHELCHTVEMNHSDRFWTLLDSVTQNKARTLRKELKSI